MYAPQKLNEKKNHKHEMFDFMNATMLINCALIHDRFQA